MRSRLISRRVLAMVAVSVVSLIGCCLLAWWQWTRYTSASGTLQNLGYVLQWPLFGVFPAFMFWRIHQAGQAERAAETAANLDGPAVPAQRAARAGDEAAQTLPEWTDQRAYVQKRASDTSDAVTGDAPDGGADHAVDATVDAELLAYNRYLAQLSAQQEDRHAG